MKTIFHKVLPLFVLLTGCSPIIYTTNQPAYTDQSQQGYTDQPLTEQVFYDELSPYGQWIDYPDYGYVWQPDVDPDFRPYVTNGNWVYSDYGWTWVSDYSWGWAPFHYGRWFYDGNYGWLWEPGEQWAPAWVTWGQSGGYYAWAPIPPGADINSGWRPRDSEWNFVEARNITTSNINNYAVRNNAAIINNTRIINNNNNRNNPTLYNRGPRAADIENATHTKIQPVKVGASPRPGQSLTNNLLNVYRPVIKQNTNRGNNAPAPQKVVAYRQNGNTGTNNINRRPVVGQGSKSYNPQQNQQSTRPGFEQNHNQQQVQPTPGQGNSPTPHQQDQRPANGQGNNQIRNQPQVQPNGQQGNSQNPLPQNQRPDNRQNNLPDPNMQLLKQREIMNQRLNQPVQQQARPNQPAQQQARPVQMPNPPAQQQARPGQVPNQPVQQQARPGQVPNQSFQPRPKQIMPLRPTKQPNKINNQKPPEKKVLPAPAPVNQ